MKTKLNLMLQPVTRNIGLVLLIFAIALVAGCGGNNENPAGKPGENDAQTETGTGTGAGTGNGTGTGSETGTETGTDADTEGTAAASWSVEHELGTLTFDQVPQKIVVLDTYLLDIALALGIQPFGVAAESAGMQELPSYLQQYANYEITWVGARNDPNLEMLTDLEPDLIVADLQRHQNSYETLEKIAPTLVVTGSGAQDWKTIIQKLGEAIQQQEKAAAVVAGFEQKLEEGKAKLASKGTRAIAPITLYPESKVRIYTADSYTGAILQGLGLELPYEAAGNPFEEVSVEAIGDVRADAFVLLQSEQYTADVDPNNYPVFSSLETVKAGQAFTVSMEQWAFYRGPLAGEVIIDEAVEIFSK